MADRTLSIQHAGGGSETYTINTDKFAGVREMDVDGNPVTIDRRTKANPVDKSTTFGGSSTFTLERDVEPLLKDVSGGASGAYSLRDLNDKANTSKVVEVRRASDDTTKSFSAKEVASGAMTDWVNATTALPLDTTGYRVNVSGSSIPAVNGTYLAASHIRSTTDNNQTFATYPLRPTYFIKYADDGVTPLYHLYRTSAGVTYLTSSPPTVTSPNSAYYNGYDLPMSTSTLSLVVETLETVLTTLPPLLHTQGMLLRPPTTPHCFPRLLIAYASLVQLGRQCLIIRKLSATTKPLG